MYIYVIFLRIFSLVGTYNTALKAAKTVLQGEVARTEAETDYDQPRKKKKNRRYISSSEDEEVDNSPPNVRCGTSSEVPAPDSLLPNKLKVLLKNKSVNTSAICQQKATCVGKLFSRNKSRIKSLSPLKLTHNNTTLDENPTKQHSLLNEGMYMYIHTCCFVSYFCVSKILISLFYNFIILLML